MGITSGKRARGIANRPWRIWWLYCLVVASVYLPLIAYQPPVQQDEVQIIEFGRGVLDIDTDWGLNWNVPSGRALLPLAWLGKIPQELAWRASAPSFFGPRALAMFWALLAASTAAGWLLARSCPRWAAFALGAALLIDPLYAETWQEGRIDGAAIAAVLASCWLLRHTADLLASGRPAHGRLVAAGALVALSPFLWPTALMLLPLVIVEAHHAVVGARIARDQALVVGAGIARDRSAAKRPPTDVAHYLRTALRIGWPFLAGAAAMAVALLLPVLLQADAFLDSLTAMAKVQERAAAIQVPVHQLLLAHTPIIVLAATASLLWRREIGLLLALAASLLLMQRTMVYPARAIYLLPYLLALVAGAAQAAEWSRYPRRKRSDRGAPSRMRSAHGNTACWPGRYLPPRVLIYLLGLLLAWNTAEVLVKRPVRAWPARAAKGPELLAATLRHTIGPGPHRVLLEDWSSYPAGRALGWRLYRAGSPVSAKRYAEFIATMDYVVVRQRPLYRTVRDLTRAAGFEHIATLAFPKERGAVHLPTLEVYRRPP